MMSDNDVVSRKDVLNMAYLSVFVDNAGREVDKPRYVIDASDVERLPAVERPMTAMEYMDALERLFVEDYYVYNAWCKLMLSAEGDKRENLHKAIAIVEAWVQENSEREIVNDKTFSCC